MTSDGSVKQVFEKTLNKDGEVIDKPAATDIPAEQAMRSHEMLLKLVNRKASPHIQEAVVKTFREFLEQSKNPEGGE